MDTSERLRRIRLGLPATDKVFIPLDSGLNVPSHELAAWMASHFNHNFDAYDTAIDSVYNSTHIGGSAYHHLLDGQHSFIGALHAVHNVNSDDGFLKEFAEATEHLLRDTASVAGINPFFSLTPNQFDHLANLCSHIGISRPFLADALTINGPELIGGLLGITGCLLAARSPNPGVLSTLSGSYIISAAASGNPMLMPIAACGLAYSLYKAEDKKDALIKAGKGAIVSGGAVLIGQAIGGPIWLGCLAGIGAAIAIRYSLDNPQKVMNRISTLVDPATDILKKGISHYESQAVKR